MAIKPKCEKCGEELREFGAILLSPPEKDNKVEKMHLCQICFKDIENQIRNGK